MPCRTNFVLNVHLIYGKTIYIFIEKNAYVYMHLNPWNSVIVFRFTKSKWSLKSIILSLSSLFNVGSEFMQDIHEAEVAKDRILQYNVWATTHHTRTVRTTIFYQISWILLIEECWETSKYTVAASSTLFCVITVTTFPRSSLLSQSVCSLASLPELRCEELLSSTSCRAGYAALCWKLIIPCGNSEVQISVCVLIR